MPLIRTFIAAALLASAVPVGVQAQDAPVTLTVDAGKPGAKIDRNIFGQFAEHLGTGIYGGVWVGKDSPIPNVRGIRSDVVAALKAIRVPNVRWPGGCFADEYHWRGGVGAPDKRTVTINSNWGGAVEDNAFGTDEFMDFADQIGAEAYVSVNLGSGTVEEAADWLAYMTADPATTAGKARAANGHPAPYKVKYLGLGNESWGCGGSMTPQHYVDVMKPFSRFVRNYNPAQTGAESMQRIAVGPNDVDGAYTDTVMKAWKEHDWAWNIEGLSLHAYTTGGWPPSYPSTGFDETGYAKLLKATLAMDATIAQHSAIMDKYDPDKKVALVVDEWGAWLAKTPGSREGFLQQQNSMRDAILAALNLNIFARHADRVRMTNIAQMINVLQAMILTDGPKMVLTPTYHVYRLYLPFQDATFVPVSFDAGTYVQGDITLPRVDAIAARDTSGKLWLAVTNLDPRRPVQVKAGFGALKVRGAKGLLLTAPKVDSVNSFDAPDAVAPKPFAGKASGGALALDLPAKAVAVVQIEE
ncbi:alpha-L-arabinofuranosidase C-terminal domain-containing protein [Sphingomonas sp.]|uniref:alpha-N-arabinofuranosidase n=1 Tax=Sphingomonas sp. TaxID=28214 RepID=UPI001B2AAAB6|nr:alpha-L-arabinofuranosidase C-terminal domain-containing protein [Sphingomonas sp.]MBO9711709.1 alpha-N-arabinofuranosidase [Sphingomonas sp.]